MDNWLELSLPLRMACLAAVGAAAGSLVNWAIYSMAFRPRAISPWSAAPPDAPPRRWTDRLPIVGWWGLRRESATHHRGHWIRPMLIELSLAVFFPWLYQWEVSGGLYQFAVQGIPNLDAAWLRPYLPAVHAQLASHLLLVTLLTAATFIDFDEQTVPDAITVTGTLVACLLASQLTFCLLPVGQLVRQQEWIPVPLLAVPVHRWPPDWDGARGLWLAVACHSAWCFALAPKLATLRWGWRRGWRFFWASLRRYANWQIPTLWVAGLIGIGIAFQMSADPLWRQLLSGILGAAVGGAAAWGIRIMGSLALGREALGFGDVTLTAMIGAFLGWQPALLAFFLAPFAALAIIVIQRAFAPNFELAFGPYIAIGAVVTLLYWPTMWARSRHFFEAGGVLLAAMLVCLVPAGLTLYLYRRVSGDTTSRTRKRSTCQSREIHGGVLWRCWLSGLLAALAMGLMNVDCRWAWLGFRITQPSYSAVSS